MKLEKNSYNVLCQEKNSITRGLGKKLDHVSFGRLLINVLANILVDYRSIYWPLCQPILGRLSTDMMVTLGRYSLSVNSRPILCQRIPWSTCRSKCRSTCQSMNWSSGSLVSANCWSRGCVLADMGLVLGHYSLLVGHGTAASQLVVCRWIACDQPIIIFIENTGLPVIQCFENLDRQSSRKPSVNQTLDLRSI